MSFLLVSSVGDALNVRAGEAGWSEAKGRGSMSKRERERERVWERTRKDLRRLQISYFNESFRKERRERALDTFLFSGVFCFLFFEVMSYKSIYYSMCSVFKCNLRKKKGRKMKKKDAMEFDFMHD